MKKLLSVFIILTTVFSVSAQNTQSLVIDQNSFKPVHTDALTGVAIDPIQPDSSRRPCARIKVHVNRMTKEQINEIIARPITNNQLTKCKTTEYDNGLIIEMTAKPQTRFYFHHDKFGDSNEVTLNLEPDKEYLLEAYLNQLYPITIASNMADAGVYIDNEYKGKTNSEFVLIIQDIVPGDHTLTIEYGGAKTSKSISVHAGSVYFRQDINVQAAAPQHVIFQVSPINAIVEFEGNILPPSYQEGDYVVMSKTFRQGSYRYTVTAPNHHPQSGTIVVRDQRVVKAIKLSAAYGWAEIASAGLEGAMIYIDDNLVSDTSRKQLASGEHTLKILKPRYKPFNTTFTIADEQVTTLSPQLEPNFARVQFVADSGVEIWINDEHIGTGTALREMDNGSYSVEGRKAGHEKSVQILDINDTASKVFNLKAPTPIYGSANIEVKPFFATVSIDGKQVGETPMTASNLLVGKHTVTITKSHYKPYTQVIEVHKNEEVKIVATLESDGTQPKATVIKEPKEKAPKVAATPTPKAPKATTSTPKASTSSPKSTASKPKQSSSSNIDLKGFQSHVQLGFAWHVSGEMPLQFSYTGGFRLNNTLFIGLGAGYKLPLGRPNNNVNISDKHTSDNVLLDCGNGIPLFLNSRIYMSKGKCKPYLSLSGGIELRGKNMIFIHDNIEGQETLTNSVPFKQNSFYIDPAFGLDFRMKGKSSFNIELGSQMTSSPYYRLSGNANTGTYGIIQPYWKFGISARIGFTF